MLVQQYQVLTRRCYWLLDGQSELCPPPSCPPCQQTTPAGPKIASQAADRLAGSWSESWVGGQGVNWVAGRSRVRRGCQIGSWQQTSCVTSYVLQGETGQCSVRHPVLGSAHLTTVRPSLSDLVRLSGGAGTAGRLEALHDLLCFRSCPEF